ncbi:O-antigen ligase family protein [Rhodohalobacter sp. 8-1]|uniref:O-antigen ligase family protein n=1 Tax=Rhodohalobacter sp. 8-1 TaxID=3131972 RepID=UPI0030EDB95A
MNPDAKNLNTSPFSHLWMSAAFALLVVAIFVIQQPLLLPVVLVVSISVWVIARTELNISDVQILSAAIFSAIVLPPLSSLPGLPSIRFEELLFLLIFPLLILKREPVKKDRLYNYFVLAVILFGTAILFSTFYGRYILGVPVAGRDFFELLKVFKILIVVVAISRFNLKESDIYKLLYVIVFSFFVSSIIGLMQYYGILGFEQITAPYYFANRLHDVHHRMMGTFLNPNTYGTVITLGAVVTCVLAFYEKDFARKISLVFLVVFFSFIIALTQSRTAIIVLTLALISVIGLNGYTGKLSFKKVALIFTGISLTVFMFLDLLSEDVLTRLSTLSNISEDKSWQMRLFAWYLNLSIFSESMLFGWGPAKMIHTTIVDSEYFLTLRRYGIVGFTIYLFIYLIPLYRAYLFQAKEGIAGVMGQIILVSIIVFLVGNITNPLFHEIQFIDYWMILLGIFFAMNPHAYNIYGKNE